MRAEQKLRKTIAVFTQCLQEDIPRIRPNYSPHVLHAYVSRLGSYFIQNLTQMHPGFGAFVFGVVALGVEHGSKWLAWWGHRPNVCFAIEIFRVKSHNVFHERTRREGEVRVSARDVLLQSSGGRCRRWFGTSRWQ